MRILWRALGRRAPPICLAAFGLWVGLACGGCGAFQLGFAGIFSAFAVSWTALREPWKRGRLLLCALCVGAALSAGVLRFQGQEGTLAGALLSLELSGSGEGSVSGEGVSKSRIPARCLMPKAVEGRLDIDSQTTARKNRRIELKVQALEFVGPNAWVRCEWKRAVFRLSLLSGAGPRLSAGTEIRAESLRSPVRGGDFFWVDARGIRQLREARPFAQLRALFAGHFARGISMAAGKAGPLAQALLLGVKDELDTEFKELFQNAGCAHLLALSGQHLSIICALVMLVGRRIARREKWTRRASLAFAWLFVWLAGPGPSLLRAVWMLTVSEVAKVLDRPQSSLAVLSHASVLLSLCAPSSINALSSVYSFSAMAGLMLFSCRFSDMLRPYLPTSIAQALSASLAAVCGTVVVSVLSFGSFIPAGILAATAAGPVMLAFMWTALAGGLLAGFVPMIAAITVPVLELLQGILTSMLAVGASLPAIQLGTSVVRRILACALIASLVALMYAVPRLRWQKARRTMEGLRARNPRLRARGGSLLFELQEE